MFIALKIAAATGIALAVLGPGFSPRADSCQCKADALTGFAVPRAEDCSCKANANALAAMVPRGEDCQCKAKAD